MMNTIVKSFAQKFPFSLQTLGLALLIGAMSMGTSCTNAQAGGNGIETIDIQTSAICGTCKQTLEKAMASTEGVKSSRLDLGNKVLTVKFDSEKTSADAIREVIAQTGYDADDVPAVVTSHDNLPACCQKDSEMH
jgi:periplasmic mercuric ion binding protein